MQSQVCHETLREPGEEGELFSSWGFKETAERTVGMGLGPDPQAGRQQVFNRVPGRGSLGETNVGTTAG